MATTAMGMAHKTKLSAVLFALIFTNANFAGDWQFDPSLKIDETYTDNVSLANQNGLSSLVSQAGINIETNYIAQHALFNFSSESTYALYSHDHELDKDYHTLSSDLRVQLWPNGIVFVISGNIENKSKDETRNALADIVSGDTIRVATYQSGFEYNIRNTDFNISSSLGYGQTDSEDSIGDRDALVAKIISSNGTSARHVFWEAEHSYQEFKNQNQSGKLSESEVKLGIITDYKFNPFIRYYNEDNSGELSTPDRSLESNSIGLGARWVVTPRLYLDISYNKPIGNKLNIEGDEQKEYVSATIAWQLSPRTILQAKMSERFYGDSYGLNFSHKNKRLTNSISYTEDVQTLTRNNFVANIIGYYFCPNGTVSSTDECTLTDGSTIFPDNPNDPDNPGYRVFPIQSYTLVEDNVFSLNKTLSWNSVLELPRTTISFDANGHNRDNIETRIEDNKKSTSFSIKRKVSGNSSVGINLSYTETNLQIDTEFERSDRYRRYIVNYEKSLNSAFSFDLNISFLNRSSNNETLNYEESRVSAKITKGF